MEIKLAGFNVDLESIELIKKVIKDYPEIKEDDMELLKKLEWTPETISASYARISRDPRAINELREEARLEIEKARKSNKAIIFSMGHSSIAEHAFFNFDILNISRLATETLEKSRLVSFTEKSQRYIKIGNDILMPEEFKSDKNFLEKYKELVDELFSAYETIHDKVVPYFLNQHPDLKPEDKGYRDIINLAKEDARYILPLGTFSQLGMSVNARSLEKIIRKLKSHSLTELQMLGEKLYKVVEGYAPSLVKYTEPTKYETNTYPTLKAIIKDIKNNQSKKEVELINIAQDIETGIFAALLVKNSEADFISAKEEVKKWDTKKKKAIFDASIKHLNSYDAVLREYEFSDIEFNILISASAFAQLKRHRIATVIDGDYSPTHGVKIPESIIAVDMKDFFLEKTGKIEKLYEEAKNKWGTAADYILSNAHKKNILFKCNLRELIHFTRLRSDIHAQWDIRNISDQIIEETKKHLPIFGDLLCGKDKFNNF